VVPRIDAVRRAAQTFAPALAFVAGLLALPPRGGADTGADPTGPAESVKWETKTVGKQNDGGVSAPKPQEFI